MAEGPVLYAEPGSTWWPLAWGPGLALVGVVLDVASGSAVQLWLWLPVAVLFALVSAVWVATRRRTRSLSLTPAALRQGREELAVADIVDVGEAGPAMGAVVLGGGWLVPSGTEGVPLRLRDGRSVLAWAVDAEALTTALRRLLDPTPSPPTPPPAAADSSCGTPAPAAGGPSAGDAAPACAGGELGGGSSGGSGRAPVGGGIGAVGDPSVAAGGDRSGGAGVSAGGGCGAPDGERVDGSRDGEDPGASGADPATAAEAG